MEYTDIYIYLGKTINFDKETTTKKLKEEYKKLGISTGVPINLRHACMFPKLKSWTPASYDQSQAQDHHLSTRNGAQYAQNKETRQDTTHKNKNYNKTHQCHRICTKIKMEIGGSRYKAYRS